MWRVIVSILALFLLGGQTPVMPGFAPGDFDNTAAYVSSSAPSYTGAGDVVSGALAFWGLEAYTAATRGNRVANVCNSTAGVDVLCADMVTSATTGQLVPQSIGGITCPGANCTVKILYDQTLGTFCAGSPCDASQGTVASRPTLIASCIGSGNLPCMQFSTVGSQGLYIPTGGVHTQPYSATFVGDRTGGTAATAGFLENTNSVQFLFLNSANTMALFCGSVVNATAADNAFHAAQMIVNGASPASAIVIDGTATTGSSGANTLTAAQIAIFGNAPGDVNVGEIGLYGIAFSSAQYASMNSNQHSRYGF